MINSLISCCCCKLSRLRSFTGIFVLIFCVGNLFSQNQIFNNTLDSHHGSMVRSVSGDTYIVSTAYNQSLNSSFVEIIKLNSSDVFQAKVDVLPVLGQDLQVFHINNGHNGELCLTGLLENQGRNYVYVAILSNSLAILNEAYYEYPSSGPAGHIHSQGHYIVPVSTPEGNHYLVGGMATDGYNFGGPNGNAMFDSKRGILLWINKSLDVLMATWLNSTYDCNLTLNPAKPYLANLSYSNCINVFPNPTDDYDQIDHIIEYAPMKFLITGSYNTPHFASGAKNFDQAALVYGINLGCGTSNPTALCIGFEFDLSFTTARNGSYDEDENAVEAVCYPTKDEACVLVNSGQIHGQILANFNSLSNTSRLLVSGLELSSYPMPFQFPIASSIKRAENSQSNVPDGVMIGGQFRKVNFTIPPDPVGVYNHSFPFLPHIDRFDPSKNNFLKSYLLRSHNFEAQFPNNMNHLLARSIENAPFTFTPSNLLISGTNNNVVSKLLFYKIPIGPPLSQLGFLSANNSGIEECMVNYDLNPSISALSDTSFHHTSLIEQQMTFFVKHGVNSPVESEALFIEPCVSE